MIPLTTPIPVRFNCASDSRVQVFTAKDRLSVEQVAHLVGLTNNPDWAAFEPVYNVPDGVDLIHKINAHRFGDANQMRVWWRSFSKPHCHLSYVDANGKVTRNQAYPSLIGPPDLNTMTAHRTGAEGSIHTLPWYSTAVVEPLPADSTMVVEVPACEDHGGLESVKVRISAFCPKCGIPRAARRWRGPSWNGSRQLTVDCWVNHCNHDDLYAAVRHEAAQLLLTQTTP